MMPLYQTRNAPRFDVVQFGTWVKRQLSIETSGQRAAGATPILTPRETFLISDLLLGDRLEAVYRERLKLGREFYFGVRQQLMAILQVWDAVIDEKDSFDNFGCFTWNQDFMEAFILCTDTIPTRVNIGSLGPPDLQSSPATLWPLRTISNDPPFAGHINERGLHETPWEMGQVNSVESPHNAEALALSDPDVGATTTDDDDEDDEDDEDEDDYYEDEEEDEDVESISQHIPRTQRPSLDGISKGLESDLQALVNDTRNAVDSGPSEFTLFQDRQSPSPLDFADPRAFDMVDMGAQPTSKGQQRYGPDITLKKRKLGQISGQENGAQDRGNLPLKRQKK